MRGIPDKLGSKQDLFNLCKDMDPHRAKLYLKTLSPETLERLGVTLGEVRTLRRQIAARLGIEKRADGESQWRKTRLRELKKRLSSTVDTIVTLTQALHRATEQAGEIDQIKARIIALHGELANLRELGLEGTGVAQAEAEVDAIRLEFREAQGSGRELRVKREELSSLEAELRERVALERRLALCRSRDTLEAERVEMRRVVTRLEDGARAEEHLPRDVATLEHALGLAKATDTRRTRAHALQQQIDGANEALRTALDAAAAKIELTGELANAEKQRLQVVAEIAKMKEV